MAIPENTAEPTASASGAETTGSRAQDRIKQLVGQKNAALEALGQVDGLKSEISELKNMLASREPAAAASDPMKAASFEDMTDETLQSQLAEAISKQDGQTAAQLQLEVARRFGSHASQQSQQAMQDKYRFEQHSQTINQQVQTRFADVLQDQQSDTFAAAKQNLGYFEGVHGANVAQERPETVLASLALAALDTKIPALQAENERLQKELATLKDGQSVGDSLADAARMSDASRDALKQGDIKAAFRNLGIVKGLE